MKVGEYAEKLVQTIVTCRTHDTVTTAATLLATNRIGAMPVCDDDGRLVGIISERDLVRAMTGQSGPVAALRVADLMSAPVETLQPDDTMLSACRRMIARKLRHMPIVENERIVGMISIRDALAQRLEDLELESNVLRDSVIAARQR